MIPKSYSFNNTTFHKPSLIFRCNKGNFMNKKNENLTTNNVISKFKDLNGDIDYLNYQLEEIKSAYTENDKQIKSIKEQVYEIENELIFNKTSFMFKKFLTKKVQYMNKIIYNQEAFLYATCFMFGLIIIDMCVDNNY